MFEPEESYITFKRSPLAAKYLARFDAVKISDENKSFLKPLVKRIDYKAIARRIPVYEYANPQSAI